MDRRARFSLVLCAVLSLSDRPASAAPSDGVPSVRGGSALTEETFDSWFLLISPSSEEIAWRTIPWRTSLQDGLAEAAATNTPVLLWLMNGHPLGCT